jgi:hypothetical protein
MVLDLKQPGCVVDPQSLEQFEISDERSPSEIAKLFQMLDMNPFGKTGIAV